MNFFQSQDNARRRTSWLVLLFGIAVLCLIGLTQLLVMVALHYGSNTALTLRGDIWSAFSWDTLAYIAMGITLVVTLASLYKMQQLRAGGAAVAELLGGQLLDRASIQTDERKILNVVEEMAIASGVPVPPVYLLEDASINAFAAGHNSHDVAIGITRGAIALLNRDELQGVIAHEFSHIFNGDMKINLQLIGWLHGILFIGLMGRLLLDSQNHRSSRNSRSAGPLIFLGIGLVIIGYCGTFFGKLIKAGISRQREFLADASAVQFTRNPDGIAGALKKIGGNPLGSGITHPNAAQISHLFFGEGLHSHFSWFNTHPPLEERIQAIDPHWDGDFPAIDTSSVNVQKIQIDPAHVNIVNGEIQYIAPSHHGITAGIAATTIAATGVAAALDAIGSPTSEHIVQARKTIDSIPDNLQKLARESWGASAIVHSLLAAQQTGDLARHLALIQQSTSGSTHSLCEKIIPDIQQLPVTLRLPLIDLCMPGLKQLSTVQRHQFFQSVIAQIQIDKKISLFEWALYRLLRQHLDDKKQTGNALSLAAAEKSCATVLSALALATQSNTTEAKQHFEAGWTILGLPPAAFDTSVLDNMTALDQAVRGLHRVQALSKPRLLKACCATIETDGHYTAESVELLRAIADTIDTPIPPVITPMKNAV
jgi:Zn-dependent protease with chaperone function